MQGLELARAFYLEYGKAMLEEAFPQVADRIAVGLAGEGSECLGFDDEISRDHDFEPGFCLWITGADEKEFGFALERAYAKLPREFMGLKRGGVSPVGGSRHGVMTVEAFYTRFLGTPTAPESWQQWLAIPSFSLGAASNGAVFTDPLGAFSRVRQVLQKGYPEDARRKKLAAKLLLMAQAGQYNYPRCVARGELGAAQLAIFEFVRHGISVIYLLNNRYEPFYKWAYRGMRQLPVLGDIADALQALTEMDNSPASAKAKQEAVEDIAAVIIQQLRAQALTQAVCGDLEKHAYSVQNGIREGAVRNLHILEGA